MDCYFHCRIFWFPGVVITLNTDFTIRYNTYYIKAKGIIGGDFNRGDNVQASVENDGLVFKVSECC